jgi:hypothetical protein
MDWKLIYQTRVWAEKILGHGHSMMVGGDSDTANDSSRPPWKVSGETFLKVLLDMILENGISASL